MFEYEYYNDKPITQLKGMKIERNPRNPSAKKPTVNYGIFCISVYSGGGAS